MLLIPAMDLKDGKCVRWRQGRMEDATGFSDDPVAMAARWVDKAQDTELAIRTVEALAKEAPTPVRRQSSGPLAQILADGSLATRHLGV